MSWIQGDISVRLRQNLQKIQLNDSPPAELVS